MYESEECTQVLFSERASDSAPCNEKLPVANLDISGEKHIIFNTKNLIGREDLCDIVIKDLSVSSRHAIIDAEDPDAHLIYDLGSTNGTKLGKIKQKPNVRYHIDEGLTVIFGNVTATYHRLDSFVTATENVAAEKNCTTIEESPEKYFSIPETPEKTEFSKPDNVDLPRKNLQEKIESPKHDSSDLDMFEEDDNSSREGTKQPSEENTIIQNEKNKKRSLYDMDTMSLEEDDIFAKLEEKSLISELETLKCKENVNTSDCSRAKSNDEGRSQVIAVSKAEKELCCTILPNLHTNVSNQSNLLNVICSNSQGEDSADVSIYDIATQEPMINENSQKKEAPFVEIGANLLSKEIKKESSILMDITCEENQCQEISSSDQRVFEPVIIPDSQPLDDSSQHNTANDSSYVIPQSQNDDIFGDTVTSDFTEFDVLEKLEGQDVFEGNTNEITLTNDDSVQNITARTKDTSLAENKEFTGKEIPSLPKANITDGLDTSTLEFRQSTKEEVVDINSGDGKIDENISNQEITKDLNGVPPLSVYGKISVHDFTNSLYDMVTQPVVAVSKDDSKMGQNIPELHGCGESSCQVFDQSVRKIVGCSEVECQSATETSVDNDLTDSSRKDFTESQKTTTDCPDGSVNKLKKFEISEVTVKEEFTESFFEAATQPFGAIVPDRQDSLKSSCASFTAISIKDFTDESATQSAERTVNDDRLEDIMSSSKQTIEASANKEFTDSFFEVPTQPAQTTVTGPPEDSLCSSKHTVEASASKEFTDSFYEVATQPAQRTVEGPPEDSLSSSKETIKATANKEFTDSFYEVATQPAQRTVEGPPEDSLSSSKETIKATANKEFTDSFFEVPTQPAQTTVTSPPEDSLCSSKHTVEASASKEFTDSFYEVPTQPAQTTVKGPPEDSLSSSKQTVEASASKEFTDSFYEVATHPAQRTVEGPPEDSLSSSKQTVEASASKEFTDSFYEVATQPAQRTVEGPPEDSLSSSKETIKATANKEFTDSFFEVPTQPAQTTVTSPPEDSLCSSKHTVEASASKEFTDSFYEVPTQPAQTTVKGPPEDSLSSSKQTVEASASKEFTDSFYEVATQPAQRTVEGPPEDSLSSSKQTVEASENKEFTDSFYDVPTQSAQRTVEGPPEDSLSSSKQTIEASANKEFTDSFYEVATQPAQTTVKGPPEDSLSSSKQTVEASASKEFTDSFYEVPTQSAHRTVQDTTEDSRSSSKQTLEASTNKEFTDSFYEVPTQPVVGTNSKTVRKGINSAVLSGEISRNSDKQVQEIIPHLLDVNFFEAETQPAIIKTVSTGPNEKTITKNVSDENKAVPKTVLKSCDPLGSNSTTIKKCNMNAMSSKFNTEFFNDTNQEIPGTASMENDLSFAATSIGSNETDRSERKGRELHESETKNYIKTPSSGATSTSLYDAETLNIVSEKIVETQEPLSQVLSQQITGTCYDADTLPFILDNKSMKHDEKTLTESSKKFEELLKEQKTSHRAADDAKPSAIKIKTLACKASNLILQEANNDSDNVDCDRRNVFEEIEKKLNIFGILTEAHDDKICSDTKINAVSNIVVTENEGTQFDTEIFTPIVMTSKKGVKRVLSDDDSDSSPVVCPKRKAKPISSEDESQLSQQTEDDFEIRFKKKPINVFPESQDTCFSEFSSKKACNEGADEKKESEQADDSCEIRFKKKPNNVLPTTQDTISNVSSIEASSSKQNNEKYDDKKEADQTYKGPFEIRFQKKPNNVFPASQDTSLNVSSTEGNSNNANNQSVDRQESEPSLEPDYFEIRFKDELVYTFPALQPSSYDEIPEESNDDEFPHESFYDEIPDETNSEELSNEGDTEHPVEENEGSSVQIPTNSSTGNDSAICNVEPKEFEEELPTAIAETSKSSDTENSNVRRSARQKTQPRNQHLIDPQPGCSRSLEGSLPVSYSTLNKNETIEKSSTINEQVSSKESVELSSPGKEKIKSFKKFKKSTPVKILKTEPLEMEASKSLEEKVTNMSEDDTQENENSYGRGKRRKMKTSFKDFIVGIDMPASQKKLSSEHSENESKDNSGTRKQSRKNSAEDVKINVKNSSVQLGVEGTVRTSKRITRFSQELLSTVDTSVSLNENDTIISPSTSIEKICSSKERKSNISTNNETESISNNTPSQEVEKTKIESPKSSGLFSLSLRPSPLLNDIWTGPADRVKLSPRVSKINAESSEKSKSTVSVEKVAKSSAEKPENTRFKRKASNDNDSPISRKRLFQGSRKEDLDSVPSTSCSSETKKKKITEGLSEKSSVELKIVDKPVETERRVSKRFKKSRKRESDIEPIAARRDSSQKKVDSEGAKRVENVQLDSITRKRKNYETSPVVGEENKSYVKTRNGKEAQSSNCSSRITRRKLAASQNINDGEGNTEVVLNLNKEEPSTSKRKEAKPEVKKTLIKRGSSTSRGMKAKTEVKENLNKEEPSTSKEREAKPEVVKKTLIKGGPSASKEMKAKTEVKKHLNIEEPSTSGERRVKGKAVKNTSIKENPSTYKEMKTRSEVKKHLNKELSPTPENNYVITDVLKETVESNSSFVPPKNSTADFTTDRRNIPIRGRKKSKEDILKEKIENNEKKLKKNLVNTLPTVVVTKLEMPSTSKQIYPPEPVEKVSKRSKEKCISPSKYLNASMSLMSQEFVFDDARKLHPPNSESCKPAFNNIRRSARTKKDDKSEDNEVNILFTGLVDSSLTHRLKQMAGELGGAVIDSPFTCTVVITNKFKRTIKLLSALARGVPIVAPDWLLDSRGFATFIDTDDYLLECKEDEKKYSFVLKESLEKARKVRFLEGWSVFVTKSVKPTPSEMKMIVECSGGKFLNKEPYRWPLKSIVISSAVDKSLWESLKRHNRVPSIVSAEAILSGVLQQHLDVDRFKIL